MSVLTHEQVQAIAVEGFGGNIDDLCDTIADLQKRLEASETDHGDCVRRLNVAIRRMDEAERQLAELQKPMACGHPKACETFDGLINDAGRIHRCTACAREKAKLALAFPLHEILLLLGYTQGPDECIGQATIHKALAEWERKVRHDEAREILRRAADFVTWYAFGVWLRDRIAALEKEAGK